jgi:hypothetical protein
MADFIDTLFWFVLDLLILPIPNRARKTIGCIILSISAFVGVFVLFIVLAHLLVRATQT